MAVEKFIKEVSAWKSLKAIRYEPLSGGYSNRIYKVFVDDDCYALRINGKQNKYLGLEYNDEVEVISLAAAQGYAPKVLECESGSDFLITEFLSGRMLGVEEACNPCTLSKIIRVLKGVHRMPYSGNRASTPFSLARGYLKGAEKLGFPCPQDLKTFLQEMDAFERSREDDPEYLKHYCHNDAFTHNMIMGESGDLKLIDWELSGLGDIWFDLATLSFSSGFDQSTDELMLQSYFGSCDEMKLKTLHDMKSVCMIREIGWALLHTALNRGENGSGADHLEFSQTVLERLKQGIVSLV